MANGNVLSRLYRTSLNFKFSFPFREPTNRAFYTASCSLASKYDRATTKSVVLKSSRALKENVTSAQSENPRKPKRHLVFGDVTVDEETYRKMQEESDDPTDNIDEEDLRNVLQKSEEFYDLYKTEEKDHRQYIRRKTLERKMFPRQVEPSLLTWAAREQVRYLHNLDPDEWDAVKISKHFPVSLLGAKKLLRSTFKHATKERIEQYDQSVHKNWGRIRKGEIEMLCEGLQEKWRSRQLKPVQALPNPALPLPPPRNTNPSPFLLDDPDKPVGEFYAIVKPYTDLQKKSEQEKLGDISDSSLSLNSASKSLVAYDEGSDSDVEDLPVSVLHDESSEIDEPSYRRVMRSADHLTHEQFKARMIEDLREEETEEAAEMLTWLENQRFSKERKTIGVQEDKQRSREKKTPKFKENIKVMYDVPKHETDLGREEAYLYSSDTGYQHPLGKLGTSKERINVNPKMKQKNGLYKDGDTFYDEDGDFVFRVFTK